VSHGIQYSANPNFEESKASDRSRFIILLLAIMAILAVLYIAWPVWRAQWPMEIDRNEGWNALQIDRLRGNLPRYPSANALIVNNYPPLSFILIRWIADFGIDPLYVGRILSLLATLTAALGIAAIIAHFQGGFRAVAAGSLWYLATMSRFFDSYVGMNDPNLLGLAVMIWAFSWVLRVQAKGGMIEAPFILMVAAGFCKHTLFAVPCCAFLWLLNADWRLALRVGIAGGAAAIGGLVICSAFYGPAFFEQLTMPRVMHAHRLVAGFGRLQWIIPAFIIWAVWAWDRRRTEQARFTVLFVIFGIFDHALQQLGDGIDDNSQFELIAALAVGIGLAFEFATPNQRLRLSAMTNRAILLIILIVRLLLNSRIEPYLLIASEQFRKIGPGSAAIVQREVNRISEIHGDVSCSIMTVCHFAGKRFAFDSFAIGQRNALAGVSLPLEKTPGAEQIHFEIIDPNASMKPFENAAHFR
jgi:hypothetical protein